MKTRSLPRCIRVALGAGLASLLLGRGLAEYPAATLPAAPDPLPEFPRGFDRFEPPADLTDPATGAPALAEWNRTAGPGDTITLTGSRLSTFTDTRVGSDTGFEVFSQAGAKPRFSEAAVQRLSGGHVAITLPTDLAKWSTYLVWPRNSAGLGRPALLNATEGWWIGPNLATRGETFAVFGRNLTHGNGDTKSWLFLQDSSGAGRWLTSRIANPYRAEFLVPDDTANGSYRVWMHNGHGAQFGWSGPLALTIDDGVPWTETEFNVRDFGAQGDGASDDFAAIDAALAAAKAAPGSTVFFPPGHYAISASFTDVPPRVRWRGAGMKKTFLEPQAGFAATNYGFILAPLRQVEIRDLSFDSLGRIHGLEKNTLLDIRGSSRVTFTRVRLSQEHDAWGDDGAPVDLHLCDHVTLRGCEILASGGLYLGTSKQLFLEGCTFRGLNDNNAFINLWGGSEVSIAHCSAADFDPRNPDDAHGWAQGRFLSGLGTWGTSRHIYFGQNRTHQLTVRPGFGNQNTGEQFLFEGLDTLIRGTPDSVGMDWVQFNGFADDYTGQMLVIVRGAGQGQSRQIRAFDANLGRITVDQPWTVRPDSTSTVAAGHYLSRVAVYKNYLSGKPRAVSNDDHIASAGVEPFGGCVDLVVTRNTFQRLRFGISNWSLVNGFGTQQVFSPNYFNQFTDNQMLGCRQGVTTQIAGGDSRPVIPDAYMLGNLFRGNRVLGSTDAAFVYQNYTGVDGLRMSVFDRNVATGPGSGVSAMTSGLNDQVWTRNHIAARGHAVMLVGPHPPALHDNRWTGTRPIYGGRPMGAVLELPFRTMRLTAKVGGLARGECTIWNSGTASLTWTAITTAPWLRLARTTGEVAGERARGELAFTAEAAGLAPGEARGTITVSAGTQSQQFTVIFTVAAAR